jgi:hypothetical protein
MTLLETVKNALRVRTSAFDGEILSLIASCKADLRRIGIKAPDLELVSANDPAQNVNEAAQGASETAQSADDPPIERAIILYAKGNFGFFEENERYLRAYDALKCSLSLDGDYH